MSELRKFQRSLDESREEKEHFVDAQSMASSDDDNSNDDSEDETKTNIQLVQPKHSKKNNIDVLLMNQLILQQNINMRAQKTIYKLKTEINTEEVKTRYLKLDLNNEQVKNEKLQTYKDRYYRICVCGIVLASMTTYYFVSSLFH